MNRRGASLVFVILVILQHCKAKDSIHSPGNVVEHCGLTESTSLVAATERPKKVELARRINRINNEFFDRFLVCFSQYVDTVQGAVAADILSNFSLCTGS